jgi:uncharacterized protein YcfL
MRKLFISVPILLLLAVAVSGCASRKKNFNEKRGLMLLESTQLGRNKSYYSKHKAKNIDKNYKKVVKKRKFTREKELMRSI